MYDVGSKQLSGIKSIYVDSLACVRVNGGENEQFKIDSEVRRVYRVPLVFQCIYGCSDELIEDGDGKEGSEIPGG